MEFEFYYYALFLATGIIAGFIDAIAGGGGIITIPVLLASGIPPHIALATNKLQGTFGSGMASINFIRKGFIHWDDVKIGVFYTFIGAALGTYAVLLMDASLLAKSIPILLVAIFVYTLLSPKMGENDRHAYMGSHLFFLIFGLGLGFYDGFFGPGTGSFLLFAFLMVGFDFIGAAANARALNFASNISASLLFAYFGLVEFSYVIPMGLAMIAGAWCGAHMALKKGTGYVRPLFVIMTTVLIGKQLIDLWK